MKRFVKLFVGRIFVFTMLAMSGFVVLSAQNNEGFLAVWKQYLIENEALKEKLVAASLPEEAELIINGGTADVSVVSGCSPKAEINFVNYNPFKRAGCTITWYCQKGSGEPEGLTGVTNNKYLIDEAVEEERTYYVKVTGGSLSEAIESNKVKITVKPKISIKNFELQYKKDGGSYGEPEPLCNEPSDGDKVKFSFSVENAPNAYKATIKVSKDNNVSEFDFETGKMELVLNASYIVSGAGKSKVWLEVIDEKCDNNNDKSEETEIEVLEPITITEFKLKDDENNEFTAGGTDKKEVCKKTKSLKELGAFTVEHTGGSDKVGYTFAAGNTSETASNGDNFTFTDDTKIDAPLNVSVTMKDQICENDEATYDKTITINVIGVKNVTLSENNSSAYKQQGNTYYGCGNTEMTATLTAQPDLYESTCQPTNKVYTWYIGGQEEKDSISAENKEDKNVKEWDPEQGSLTVENIEEKTTIYVKYVATYACNCKDSAWAQVTYVPCGQFYASTETIDENNPKNVIKKTICLGDNESSKNLTAYTEGGSGSPSYEWTDSEDNEIVGEETISVTYNKTDQEKNTYTCKVTDACEPDGITLTYTLVKSATGNETIDVKVYDDADEEVGSPAIICGGENYTLKFDSLQVCEEVMYSLEISTDGKDYTEENAQVKDATITADDGTPRTVKSFSITPQFEGENTTLYYRVRINIVGKDSKYSDAIQFKKEADLKLEKAGNENDDIITVCRNKPFDLEVEAEGYGEITWEILDESEDSGNSDDSGSGGAENYWIKVTADNAEQYGTFDEETMTFTAQPITGKRRYRCTATDKCNSSADSKQVEFTCDVYEELSATIKTKKDTEQDEAYQEQTMVVLCKNGQERINIKCEPSGGNDSEYKYQWYHSSNNGASWNDGSATQQYANGSAVKPMNDTWYKCKVTDKCGDTCSVAVLVKILTTDLTPKIQIVDADGEELTSVCPNKQTSYTLKMTNLSDFEDVLALDGYTLTAQFYDGETALNNDPITLNNETSSVEYGGNVTLQSNDDAKSYTLKITLDDNKEICGKTEFESSVVELSVYTAPTIAIKETTYQDGVVKVCSGSNAALKPTITGDKNDLSYQWWKKEANETDFSPIGGEDAKKENYTVSNVTNTDVTEYKLVVMDKCGNAITNGEITYKVSCYTDIAFANSNDKVKDADAQDITSPILVCSGKNVTLMCPAVSGGSYKYTYQWQSSIDGENNWTNVSGATKETFTSGALTTDIYYRCEVKDATCSDMSEISDKVHVKVLTTDKPEITVSVNGATAPVCPGEHNIKLELTKWNNLTKLIEAGHTLTAQFYDEEGTVGDGETSITKLSDVQTTLSDVDISADKKYYLEVTSNKEICDGKSLKSNEVTVSVVKTPIATADEKYKTVCYGGSVTLAPTLENVEGATYQWKSLGFNAGDRYEDVDGATSPTLTIDNVTNIKPINYKLVITNKCDEYWFKTPNGESLYEVRCYPKLSAGEIEVDNSTVCAGEEVKVTFKTKPSDGSGNYTYEWYVDGTLQPDKEEASATFTFSDAGEKKIKVKVKDACDEAETDEVTVTVKALPEAPVISSSKTGVVCQNEEVTYRIKNYNSSNTYTWSLADGSLGTLNGNGKTATVEWKGRNEETAINVTVKNNDGCESKGSLDVEICDEALPAGQYYIVRKSKNSNILVLLNDNDDSSEGWYQWYVVKGGKDTTLVIPHAVPYAYYDIGINTDKNDYFVVVSNSKKSPCAKEIQYDGTKDTEVWSRRSNSSSVKTSSVVKRQIPIQINNPQEQIVKIRLFDSHGALVLTREDKSFSSVIEMVLDVNTSSGMYILYVLVGDEITTVKILVE